MKKLQKSICVDWNFINQKIPHSQETLQSLSPKTSLGPSTLVGSDHSQSTFVVRPRGTKLNTTKVYLVLFKEIRGNIMESSLQSSRGLKTFQSRDFLNGIKGWEDLHLEFWCQTDWDIFLFLPSTSSLCSTERISFGTEIWKGYYIIIIIILTIVHWLSPGTRSPRHPAPRYPL